MQATKSGVGIARESHRLFGGIVAAIGSVWTSRRAKKRERSGWSHGPHGPTLIHGSNYRLNRARAEGYTTTLGTSQGRKQLRMTARTAPESGQNRRYLPWTAKIRFRA